MSSKSGKPPVGRVLALLLALAMVSLGACALPLPPATPTSIRVSATPTALPLAGRATQPTATPASPPSKDAGTTLKIGYLAPLSGPLGPLGHLEKVSLVLAQEDISKEGGISGSPLQVIRYDSSDPKRAGDLVRKLANDDKVLAILGPFTSEEVDIAAPLANQLRVPTISMRASKPGLSEKRRPWAFRITVTDDIHTKTVVAAFKKLYPNVKRVLIVGTTGEGATETLVKETWPKHLAEAGYEVQGTISYTSGATDYSRLVAGIKDKRPEAIAYAATPLGNPVAFARELAVQQVGVPVMTSVHLVPGLFAYQAATETEGWLSASFFDPTGPDQRVQDFIKRWQAAADVDPDVTKPARLTLEANAYDALQVLAYVMRRANIAPTTPFQEARTKIRDGLQVLKDYRGISGITTMQTSGDATWPPTPVIARNGAWVTLK